MPSESVKVVVRVRPLSRKEQQDGHVATTVAEEARGTITCTNPKADASDPPKSNLLMRFLQQIVHRSPSTTSAVLRLSRLCLMVTTELYSHTVRRGQEKLSPWKASPTHLNSVVLFPTLSNISSIRLLLLRSISTSLCVHPTSKFTMKRFVIFCFRACLTISPTTND